MSGRLFSDPSGIRWSETTVHRRLRALLGETRNIVRQTLFSPACKLCGQELVHRSEVVICSTCREKIRISEISRCPFCGKFIETAGEICGSCSVQHPPFVRHASYALYEDALKDVILLYKYGEIMALKNLLADCYLDLMHRLDFSGFDFIVPVPSNRKSKREFKPVHEIGRILSRRLEIVMLDDLLIKVRDTPPQVGLTHRQRIRNLNGVFRLDGRDRVRGKRVLLVDDVYTTGTTVRKCAETLNRAKVNIHAVTLAQSVRP